MKSKLKKIKIKVDKLLRVSDSKDELSDFAHNDSWPQEMVVTGDLSMGKNGNPVTILVEDEITGETLEVNGVRNAFLVIEDTRKNTSGWLALAVGGVEKLSEVLTFLSQTTLDSIKKLARLG
jgi:hypothetical protein